MTSIHEENIPRPPPPKEAADEAPKLCPIGSLLDDAIDRARARREKRELPVSVPWPELAEQLGGGLWPGLHVLVGGTGSGKSTLALQLALAAAKEGTPTAYVGLELGELDIALRLLGGEAGVSWSRLYTGRSSEHEVTKAEGAKGALAAMPFYVEVGKPQGWPASELEALAERMRAAHPKQAGERKPMLLVLDFLQIVGDEPNNRRPAELRERIGKAAYFARDVARRLDVAVLVISSAARDKYGALSGAALDEAGIRVDAKGRRFVYSPDVLVGLGKESGDLEYSADSVTAMVRGPKMNTAEGSERCAVLVTAKGRATGAGWCALRFENGQRFTAWASSTTEVVDGMRASKKKANGKKAKGEADDEGSDAEPSPAKPSGNG